MQGDESVSKVYEVSVSLTFIDVVYVKAKNRNEARIKALDGDVIGHKEQIYPEKVKVTGIRSCNLEEEYKWA